MFTSLLWFRRDLRLDDHPALHAALRAGALVPVYVHAPEEEAPWSPGAASDAWLRCSLRRLQAELRALGSRLLLRRGPSLAALETLIAQTGATAVHWSRLYEPAAMLRDNAVTLALRQRGLHAQGHPASVWVEPWDLKNKSGEPYRVFTPFWKTLRARLDTLPAPLAKPARLPAVPPTLASEKLDALLPPPQPRWDRPLLAEWQPGEAGALGALADFAGDPLAVYAEARDRPDRPGTSRLSPHLHFGEISPRRIFQRMQRDAAAEPFLRQLGWREFGVHLLHHFPHTPSENLNPRFQRFPWADDADLLEAWKKGRTGVPLVDAGMHELWHTGWMHNRVRMIAASFLVKHLRQHWLSGARWFWDTLVDADLANNTLGWQWVAGTGADAAPYFRVFNPITQAERFDPQRRYLQRWLPEGYRPQPIVDLADARATALAAYAASR